MKIGYTAIPIELDLSPYELYRCLDHEAGTFLLESSLYHPEISNQSIIVFNPKLILEFKKDGIYIFSNREDVGNEYIEKIRKVFNSFQKIISNYFAGGFVGYFSYDFGLRFENILPQKKALVNLPEFFLCYYENGLTYDHNLKQWIAAGIGNVDKMLEKVYEKVSKNVSNCSLVGNTELKSNFSFQEYIYAVERVKNHIRVGDVYQVNLAQQFYGKTQISPIDLYGKLRISNPAPYSALLCLGEDRYVLSSSPELFLDVRGIQVETRPIKGTIERGKNTEEDEILKQKLLASTKDDAELMMIVDLERNDLNRVCKTGSVKVNKLKTLETYASVHHLVASIFGELEEKNDIFDLIKSAFPGGSITGAPKIRAMQIIDEVEPHRRGIYTGSIGYIGLNQISKFNIAIRTISYNQGKISFGLGGGIVLDSDPELEYRETLQKGKAIFDALGVQITW